MKGDIDLSDRCRGNRGLLYLAEQCVDICFQFALNCCFDCLEGIWRKRILRIRAENNKITNLEFGEFFNELWWQNITARGQVLTDFDPQSSVTSRRRINLTD